MSLARTLDSPRPAGAHWNLARPRAFGHWPIWMVHPRGEYKVAAPVTTLEAYCDESGIHRGAAVCVVVGFVASAREWQRFEERWPSASAGVVFHGKRFFGRDDQGQRVKPYEGWTDDQALEYLAKIMGVITGSRIKPIGGVIDTEAFDRLSEVERRYLTGASFRRPSGKLSFSGAPTKPYYLGFVECLARALADIRRPGLKLNFIFDRQNEFAPYATRYFHKVLQHGVPEIRRSLGELMFKDKTGVAGLQAADLLAHACYRRTGTNLGENLELDYATEQLRPMAHRRIVQFDEQTIRGRIADAPEELRRRWRVATKV